MEKVAVIGSGVMGSAIAAQIANTKTQVFLYDIVDDASHERSSIAKQAIEKLISNPLKPLLSKNLAKYITPCNLEDDLDKLKNVDWVIEAVTENIDIKKSVYNKIHPFLKPSAVISSNTSTIPLSEIIENSPAGFKERFIITHFFNPPRYLSLLEFVSHNNVDSEIIDKLQNFLSINLGRTIVNCKDSPGFIANRIGCFWLEIGLYYAIYGNIDVNIADHVITRYMGVPKTGIFGLWDLIGIDVMLMISESMMKHLPSDDAYVNIVVQRPKIIENMVKTNRLGRKSKEGGFYKIVKEGDKKVTYVKDLRTGAYLIPRLPDCPKLSSLKEFFSHPTSHGLFLWKVVSRTLNYAASLIPDSAFSVYDIDIAMKEGYGWKYGPFELIDQLSDQNQSGAEWLRIKLELDNIAPAPILKKIGNNKFYNINQYNKKEFFFNDTHLPIKYQKGCFSLEDYKNYDPIIENGSAALWNLDDGVLCLELKNKLGLLDKDSFDVIIESISILNASDNFIGMVIGNDNAHFSAGADVNKFLDYAENQEFDKITDLLSHGQKAMTSIKLSKKPVISAVSGNALGGGCELLLHSYKVQMFSNVKIGLVETNIGLIPGWGGCKEMIFRPFHSTNITNPTNDIANNFNLIFNAITMDSGIEAQEMGLLGYTDIHLTMNRQRLLGDAKRLVLETANKLIPYEARSIHIDVNWIEKLIRNNFKNIDMATHEEKIFECLLQLFTNKGKSLIHEDNILELEKEYFLELIKTKEAKDRIISMIKDKKLLRN